MDNGEFSLLGPQPRTPAAPAAGAPSGGVLGAENPFGEQGVRRSVWAPAEQPPSVPRAPQEKDRSLKGRIRGALAAIAALVAKFFAFIKSGLLLLPKLKVLTTAGTALISVAAYSLFFGWSFAAGFVALIFIHEMGHVFQLRREGLEASAPWFIPFFGAVIGARSLGENALAEARVGLAGPILGTVGSAACLAIGEATNSDFMRALAYVGFLLNLFNLLPVVPLDGGRAMAATAPSLWFVGLGALIVLFLLTHNPFLLIISLLAGLDTYRRWKMRGNRSIEQAAYYRVSPRNRMLVGAVYIALIVVLVLGMGQAHVLSSGGHTFGSI